MNTHTTSLSIVHPFMQSDTGFIMDPTKLYHSTNRLTRQSMLLHSCFKVLQIFTTAATQAYKESVILVTTTCEFCSANPHACVNSQTTKYTYNFIYAVYILCTVKLSTIVMKTVGEKKVNRKTSLQCQFVHHNLSVHICMYVYIYFFF
jgi:hypothetical protein